VRSEKCIGTGDKIYIMVWFHIINVEVYNESTLSKITRIDVAKAVEQPIILDILDLFFNAIVSETFGFFHRQTY
jgi:hypothetical protein